MPFQKNGNKHTIMTRNSTASIKLAKTTNQLNTTINSIKKLISILPSISGPQKQIRSKLNKYMCDLSKCGNFISTKILPSLTTGHVGCAFARYMNINHTQLSILYIPTIYLAVSSSKRAKLTLRSSSSNNIPFPNLGTEYSPDKAMEVLIKNSTQTASKCIKLMTQYGYVPLKKTEMCIFFVKI